MLSPSVLYYYFVITSICYRNVCMCTFKAPVSFCSHFKDQQTPVFDNESSVSKETFSPESTAQILLSAAWSKADSVRRKRTISVVPVLQKPVPFDLLFVPSLWSRACTSCNLFSSQFTYLCRAITQHKVSLQLSDYDLFLKMASVFLSIVQPECQTTWLVSF